MNFNNLIRIHKNIEKEFPDYGYALKEYIITDQEKQKQKIFTDNVSISKTFGFSINGKFIKTEDDDLISWSDFLVVSELCKNVTPTCYTYHNIADKVMYCLYLLAVDNSDSRKELRNIFTNEELESCHFSVDCNDNYLGKHIINEHGWCTCMP